MKRTGINPKKTASPAVSDNRLVIDQQNRHVHFEPFRENELLLVAT